jgi:hypothetical protein
MVSTLWNLHLENDGFSEAAGGWSPGLCIQLASIEKSSDQLSAAGYQLKTVAPAALADS